LKKKLRQTKFENSLSDITKSLESTEKRRETLIKDSRNVLALCSRSIVAAHAGDFREADAALENAKTGLKKLREAAEHDLEKYLLGAEIEFVEASVFISILKTHRVIGGEELGVRPGPYILGLLDTVGEIKRKVFDSVRVGEQDEAVELFQLADEIYSSIKPLAVFDNVVPGIRRKLDVDRNLLEDMRALITEEVRRERLLKSMDRFERRMGRENKPFN
jgi:translin